MKCRLILGVAAMSAIITTVAPGITVEQLDAMTSAIRSTCIKKTGADPELVKIIREGKFTEGDQNLKCYTRCIMDITKVFKDGRMDLNKMAKQMTFLYPKDTVTSLMEVARKCDSETKEDDECDFVWSFLKCSYSADPDSFSFP